MRYFDSSQILICFYEAISSDPTGLLSGIAKFLDIDSFKEASVSNQTRINSSPAYPMPAEVKNYLLDIYAPAIQRLAKVFGSYAIFWQGAGSSDNLALARQKKSTSMQFSPTIHL